MQYEQIMRPCTDHKKTSKNIETKEKDCVNIE